jgi:hypothetical protein
VSGRVQTEASDEYAPQYALQGKNVVSSKHFSLMLRPWPLLPARKNPHFKSSLVLFSGPHYGSQSGVMNSSTTSATDMNGVAVMPTRRKASSRDGLVVTDKLLTPDEVALLLDVKMSWLMDHVSRIEPIIPHIRIGKVIRFKRAVVIDWLDSLISTKPTWEQKSV